MKFNIQQVLKRMNGKRSLLGMLLGAAVAVSACAVSLRDDTANLSLEDKMLRHKYRGIHGGVLYFDASGYCKRYVTMQTQSGQMWRATMAGFCQGGAVQLAFTDSMYIPKTIRVIWRTGEVRERRNEKGHTDYHVMGFEGGTILGDYTVPVAGRIPDEILDYIRQNGGALRLKIRLKDDGVLIGWDVEKSLPIPGCKPGEVAVCTAVHYLLPGGDFREARGTDPGWEK